MADLSKQDLLDFDDIEIKKVDINLKGLKGNIYVKTISAYEKDKLEVEIEKNPSHVRAKYVALCVCDKDGKRLFDDSDIYQLSKKSLKFINPLFFAAIDVNSIKDEDIEQEAKN